MLIGCYVNGASHFSSNGVVDGNGVPIGACTTQYTSGFDDIVDTTNAHRLRTDFFLIGDDRLKDGRHRHERLRHAHKCSSRGTGLHVLKRASLSAQPSISVTKSRMEWLRTNAINLGIRFLCTRRRFHIGWRTRTLRRTCWGLRIERELRARARTCDGGDVRAFREQPGGLGGGEDTDTAEENSARRPIAPVNWRWPTRQWTL